MLLRNLFLYALVMTTMTARPSQAAAVAPLRAHRRRYLMSFASCDAYTTYFQNEAIDSGGAICECSLDGPSNDWVASCVYNCDFCLDDSGCFVLSSQRFSSGAEWECLDYSAQSSSPAKLCTLYDAAETEVVVSIDDDYCLPTVSNASCNTGYQYDCSNIGRPVICSETDAGGDNIWQIAFSESEELCAVGTCVDGRTTTFPEPEQASVALESSQSKSEDVIETKPISNAEIVTIGVSYGKISNRLSLSIGGFVLLMLFGGHL